RKFTSKSFPAEPPNDFHGSRCEGKPDLLNHRGWLAIIILFELWFGMNQPCNGTPSSDGKKTFSYSSPYSSGQCKIGAFGQVRNPSAIFSKSSFISLLFITFKLFC